MINSFFKKHIFSFSSFSKETIVYKPYNVIGLNLYTFFEHSNIEITINIVNNVVQMLSRLQ